MASFKVTLPLYTEIKNDTGRTIYVGKGVKKVNYHQPRARPKKGTQSMMLILAPITDSQRPLEAKVTSPYAKKPNRQTA